MLLSVAFLLIIAGLIVATAGVRWARTRRAARLSSQGVQGDATTKLGVYAAVVVAAACGS